MSRTIGRRELRHHVSRRSRMAWFSALGILGCADPVERICEIQVECGVYPVDDLEDCLAEGGEAVAGPCGEETLAVVDCLIDAYRGESACPAFDGSECATESAALEACDG